MRADLPPGLASWARGEIARIVELGRQFEEREDLGLIAGDSSGQFEEMMGRLDRLFGRFQLPALPEFSRFFDCNPELPLEDVVEAALANLVAVRSWWQERADEPREQILADAVARRLDPRTALPLVGVPVHVYTIFVYKTLLQGEASVFGALAELDRAVPLLDDIGRAASGQHPDPAVWSQLAEAGLCYVDQFLGRGMLVH